MTKRVSNKRAGKQRRKPARSGTHFGFWYSRKQAAAEQQAQSTRIDEILGRKEDVHNVRYRPQGRNT